ncbi:hypothetical protein BH20ACT9_BH20ACT9_16430 [soil metagenome]
MAGGELGRTAQLVGVRPHRGADLIQRLEHGRDLLGASLRAAAQQRVADLVRGQIEHRERDRPGLVGGDEVRAGSTSSSPSAWNHLSTTLASLTTSIAGIAGITF